MGKEELKNLRATLDWLKKEGLVWRPTKRSIRSWR